jgi:hypothetical protein
MHECCTESKQEKTFTKVLLGILAQNVSAATQTPGYLLKCRNKDTIKSSF